MKKIYLPVLLGFLSTIILMGCRKDSPTKTLNISGTLNFDTVIVNYNKTMQFTISNSGNSTVSVKSINCPAGFTVDWSNGTIKAGGSQVVNVTFAPTAAQSYSGQISILSDATSGSNSIAVNATGKSGKPVIGLSATSIVFGNDTVGQTKTQNLTITNTGTSNLTISSIISNNTVFTISSNYPALPIQFPITITPNSNVQLVVNFIPTSVGNSAGTLTISSNVDSNKTVSLTGTGIAPILNVSTTALSFGNVTVGNTVTQTFTISNTGNLALSIASITSNNSVFTIGSYPSSIAPNSSATVTITFKPVTAGSITGTLTINTNAGNKTITVSGTGTNPPAPALTVSTTSLSFGNVTVGNSTNQTFIISNTGNTALSITSISSDNSVFTIGSYPSTIAANVSATITVICKPTTAGDVNGTITISTTVGYKVVLVSGTGVNPILNVSPTSLSFGNVAVGYSSDQTVTISNTGIGNLSITSISLDNAVFTINGSYSTSPLAPNSSTIIDFIFKPTKAGSITGSITINTNAGSKTISLSGTGTNDPILNVSPTSLSFGNVEVGSGTVSGTGPTFYISNGGNSPLSIADISSDNTAFRIFGQIDGGGITPIYYPYTISNHSGVTIMLGFYPTIQGSANGTIVINTSVGNRTVSLTGIGTPVAAILNVSPTSLSFGNVAVGSLSSKTVTISNTGTGNLSLLSNTVSNTPLNPSNSAFTVGSLVSSIAPNGSATITVTFKPITTGSITGTWTIYTNAGNTTISLSGIGY